MGAWSINFEVDGNKSFYEVLNVFKKKQGHDSSYNGHRDGYSGDFQTLDTVEDHSHKGVFNCQNKAHDYALNKSEKWSFAVAVKYKVIGETKKTTTLKTIDKKLTASNVQLKKLNAKVDAWTKKLWVKRFPVMDKKKTFKCSNCKSTINLKFVEPTMFWSKFEERVYCYKCPVCERGLILPAQLKRANQIKKEIEKVKDKIDQLVEKRASTVENLNTKAAIKSTKTKWLIVGWGAS